MMVDATFTCDACGDTFIKTRPAGEATAEALALPFAGRRGYREEWRP